MQTRNGKNIQEGIMDSHRRAFMKMAGSGLAGAALVATTARPAQAAVQSTPDHIPDLLGVTAFSASADGGNWK